MRLAAIVTAVLLAACASSAEPVPVDPLDDPSWGDSKADGATTAWTAIGRGVAYQRVNAGHAIVLAYGGYTARLSDAATWATELVSARLGALDVGEIYAIKGPADAGYDGREIANTKLRAHLLTIDDGTSPIYVVAHSSGSYVAHELLGQLHAAGDTGVLARIAYADLDGGGTGLTPDLVDELRTVAFVSAHDPTLTAGYSRNHATAVALAAAYAPHATSFVVEVPATGCDDGASWCLHDVLVTHRPHDPAHYDLAEDYTDFVDRPVTTEYF